MKTIEFSNSNAGTYYNLEDTWEFGILDWEEEKILKYISNNL